MTARCLLLVGLVMLAGCDGDPMTGTDGGTTGRDATTPLSDGGGPLPLTCADGTLNGDETGVDCGGSCPQQNCCANGFVDTGLGETGTDCGGMCGSCTANCRDGEQGPDETGVDCGGACGGDCCDNGYADVGLGETGVDCGGTCGACGPGTTYFVASDGDDGNDGTSPTTPWASIDRVNGTDLQPGDAVLFRRGDTWREQLMITRSGTSAAWITFGAYGTGDKPRILGSIAATGWSAVAGHPNVWRSGNTIARPNVGKASSIFFGELSGDTRWGRVLATDSTPECDSTYSFLTQEHDWCWADDAIFVYSPSDPSTRYDFVEVPQRRSAIAMESHAPAEYVVIDGLELMYTTMYGYDDGWPMDYEVHGLTIRNCHIGYVGIQGGGAAMGLQIWHSDMVVRNNEIHDCGRRSVSYNVYLDNGRSTPNLVFENVLIEDNVLYHGFHTTGLDISCEPGSGGDTFNDTFRNFTIRNNLVWDDPSHDPQASPNDFTSQGIYLWGESALFTDFHIYNNVLKHIKQKALILMNVQNTQVYNNTFWSMNERAGVLGTGSGYRGLVTVSGGVSNLSFDNNLLYGSVRSDQYHLQLVSFSGGSESGVVSMDHNLYFQEDGTQALVSVSSGSYDASEWSAYQSDTGFDASSPTPGNPMLSDPDAFDFRPTAGSPVIDAGATIAGRTTDYIGGDLVGTPDIGAVEYHP